MIVNPYQFAYPVISSLLDNRPFVFDASNMSTSFVESANADLSTGTPPATMVASDGDSVGTIYCKGFGGKHIRTAGNTNRPVWKNQGGICYWQWASGAVVMTGDTSVFIRDYTRPFHQPTPSFRLGMLMRIDIDSLSKVIFATKTSTSTNAGIDFTHNANNAFFIRSANGTSLMVNVTNTTGTKNVASGWFYMFFDQQGTAARFGLDSMASPQSITAANAGLDVVSGQALQIGSPGLSIAKIVVETGIWDTTAVNAFKAEPTTPNTNKWASYGADYDYHTGAFLDTACTSPAIVANDQIRGVKNTLTTAFGSISATNGTTTSGAASPVIETSSINGFRAGLFNANGTRIVTYGRPICPSLCGLQWWGLVAKNLNANFGSHWGQGSSYMGYSGSGYLVGEHPVAYQFLHGTGAPTPNSETQVLKNNAQVYNAMVIVRQGGRYISCNGAYEASDDTMAAIFQWTNTGTSAQGASWNPNGPFARLISGTGYFGTGAEAIEYARGIMQGLNTTYAL